MITGQSYSAAFVLNFYTDQIRIFLIKPDSGFCFPAFHHFSHRLDCLIPVESPYHSFGRFSIHTIWQLFQAHQLIFQKSPKYLLLSKGVAIPISMLFLDPSQ